MVPIIVIILLLIFLRTGSIGGTMVFIIKNVLRVILIFALLISIMMYIAK